MTQLNSNSPGEVENRVTFMKEEEENVGNNLLDKMDRIKFSRSQLSTNFISYVSPEMSRK